MSDVAVAAAARMAPAQRSPSPWSRFLSPSLFSQRSTPGQPSAAVAPSPLKESTTVPHQPGLFTHAKEINPFERSFAVLEPLVAAATTLRNGVLASEAHRGHAEGMLQEQGMDRTESGRAVGKRKRALSSPAVLTPGGSATHAFAGEGDGTLADFIQKAKRPTLSVRNQDSGVGLLDDRDLGSGPYSLRTSVNGSFDSTSGSSLLRHRRGVSLSESPDTSVAPSPPSPKQGPSPPALAPPPPNASAASHGGSAITIDNRNSLPHFQTQPMPFSMPIVPSTTAFANPVVYSSAPAPIVAATSVAPNAVVPPPTSFAYGADANGQTQFMPPPPPGQLGAAFAPMEPQLQQPYFVPSFAAAGPHLPFDPSLAIQNPAMYPNIPAADVSLRHQQLYSGYPALPAPPLPPPPPPPPSSAPVNPPAAVASGGTYANGASGSVAAASMSPVAQGRSTTSNDGAPANDRSSVTPVSSRLPGPKKRGRKPKNWDPATEQTVELDPEEQEKQRKLALERNRVAASKSRRRKKERVELLENAAAELCTRNVALQAECRTLLAEVHNLRTYMSQSHPQGACSCQHVNGYVAREAEGGGIPAILYGAGKTLERDYTHPPKWGSEDDALAGAIELRALEAITRGGKLGDLPEEDGPAAVAAAASGSSTLTTGKATKGKSSSAATAVGRTASQRRSRDMDVDDLLPVVGRAKGAIPVRGGGGGGASVSPSAPTRPGMATRRSSSIAVNKNNNNNNNTGGGGGGHDSDHDFDDSEGEESEAEHIALKSRRARAISLRKAA